MTRNVDQLRSIQTFEELIPFLEDDLDWPFPHGSQEYEFDDLTFEYTPDELGLEDEYAAKIKGIHQLRPLVSGQPWGIFFVEFENKKLPIVVLRRILSHLVLKQRKSANPADRARWNAGDLLFISAFAEEGTLQREIAFAHFHQDPGDQPTLRVLGWDGGDTSLKLEHVFHTLKQRLSWPRNSADHAAWRKQWAGAFRYRIGQQIRTADMLAQELARVARNIRDAAAALMKVESSRGPLRRMHQAFQVALIHDLTQEGFADTYAQTITYGLLTAAISRTDQSAGADGTFVLAEDLHNMVPITNPFLKEMLESFLKVGGRGTSKQPGLDFDELGVQEVVEMLRSSEIDLPAVLEDFGNRNPGEDPVIRFYEDFLKAYNKELKIKRGVFYTPQPVVSYIVRNVHESLQRDFGLPDGLASTVTWGEMASQMAASGNLFTIPKGTSPDSHFVVVLDPATGTATFLVEVIDVIFKTLTEKWKIRRMTPAQRRDEWNRYVPVHLLPRLFGYELMMAPYAIAHMKIGLKLHETGYTFDSDTRVRVYLTNALEPSQDFFDKLAFEIPALAHEAEAVNRVKQTVRFTVIVGNPPYASVSSNMSQWIRDQANTYINIDGVRIEEKSKRNPLQNDYVKFIRLAHILAEQAGSCIIGLITSASYLDGRTLRGMRWHLKMAFQTIRIVDLRGDSNKNETDASDENVFDIKEGVSILLMSFMGTLPTCQCRYGEMLGSRAHKYELLTSGADVCQPRVLDLSAPLFLFRPILSDNQDEYEALGVPIDKLFDVSGAGIITNRDGFATAYSEKTLLSRMEDFANASISDDAIRVKYSLSDNSVWKLPKARMQFRRNKVSADYICPLTYRPFDIRLMYYEKSIVFNPRFETMKLMVKQDNLAIVTTGQMDSNTFSHVFASKYAVEKKLATSYGASIMFPFRKAGPKGRLFGVMDAKSNLTAEAEPLLASAVDSDPLDAREPTEAVGAFMYAVLYAPTYRQRYQPYLKLGFPRIPVPKSTELFGHLSRCGQQLLDLHTMREAAPIPLGTYTGPEHPLVGRVTYKNSAIWLNGADSGGFMDVSEQVWNFEIGGYQVCNKWLKDRKETCLSKNDIETYGNILASINETIRVMDEIDKRVEEYGGWPGAFA